LLRVLRHEIWQNPALERVDLASITKNSIHLAMAMQINTAENLVLFRVAEDGLLDLVYLRVKNSRGKLPSAVQVYPADVTSEISVDNSIDVDHRENDDNKVPE
jgi:hypothetical protein